MKAKIKNNLNFVNCYIGNSLFLTLSIILFVLVIVYSYYIGNDFSRLCSTPNLFDGVIWFLKDTFFVIIIFLLPMLIIAISVMYNFEKFGSNLLRFKTKKEYINHIISNCIKSNTIFFLIIVLFIFVTVFCLVNNQISFIYIDEYKTLNILYLIVYLFKIYFIGLWLSVSSILLFKLDIKIISIVLNLFVYMIILTSTVKQSDVISSIFEMPLLIGEYLQMLNYSSFILEIICFIIFVIFLLLLGKVLYIECNKRMKNVGVE